VGFDGPVRETGPSLCEVALTSNRDDSALPPRQSLPKPIMRVRAQLAAIICVMTLGSLAGSCGECFVSFVKRLTVGAFFAESFGSVFAALLAVLASNWSELLEVREREGSFSCERELSRAFSKERSGYCARTPGPTVTQLWNTTSNLSVQRGPNRRDSQDRVTPQHEPYHQRFVILETLRWRNPRWRR